MAGSFGRGTLSFVGLAPVDRTMIYEARTLSARARRDWARKLEAIGAGDARALARRLGRRGAAAKLSSPAAPERIEPAVGA